LAGDRRHRPSVECDDDVRGDLDPQLTLVDFLDDSVDSARCDDLVANIDGVLHRLVRAFPAAGGDHEDPPGRGEDGDEDQEAAHGSLSSRSRLYEAKLPRSIASRAPAVSPITNRRLWRESSRRPRSSFWFTRWRM